MCKICAAQKAGKLLEALDQYLESEHEAGKREAMGPVENEIEGSFQEVFKLQEDIILAKFEKAKKHFNEASRSNCSKLHESAGDDFNKYLDEAFLQTVDVMDEKVKDGNRKAMDAAAKKLIADVGVEVAFDLENPRAVEYLNNHAADMVRNINETTRNQTARIVTKGVREGKSYDETARELKNRFEEYRIGRPQEHIRSRSRHIAVTEAAHGFEEGNREAAKQIEGQGILMEKAWLTVEDDVTSDGCWNNQQAGWIDIDEPFPSGHQRSPRFPGCRCSIIYRRKQQSNN